MGMLMPDEIIEFAGANWKELGYNPFLVFRLLERGLTHSVIDRGMRQLVGDDWLDVNVSTWIDRIEEKYPDVFKDVPGTGDSRPVVDILEEMLR